MEKATLQFLRRFKVPESHLKSDASDKVDMEKFVPIASEMLGHQLTALCFSACRQRRRLSRIIRQGALCLRLAASRDQKMMKSQSRAKFQRFCTAFQALTNSLCCVSYLKLGASLGLYEVDEIGHVYYYLSHIHHELSLWKEQVDKAKEEGGGNKKKKKSQKSKIKILTSFDLERSAESNLGKAVFYTFLYLQKKSLFQPPVYELQDGKMRWYQRFLVLCDSNSLPPPLHYQDFAKMKNEVMNENSAQDLLCMALEAYKSAKEKVDATLKSRKDTITEREIRWLKSVAKVAVINMMQLQSKLSGSGKSCTLHVAFDVNACFPTISGK